MAQEHFTESGLQVPAFCFEWASATEKALKTLQVCWPRVVNYTLFCPVLRKGLLRRVRQVPIDLIGHVSGGRVAARVSRLKEDSQGQAIDDIFGPSNLEKAPKQKAWPSLKKTNTSSDDECPRRKHP